MIKTTLVPGVPWPNKNTKIKPKSLPDETDEKFVKWYMEKGASKHLKPIKRIDTPSLEEQLLHVRRSI